MSATRPFPLPVVLSVLTGRPVAPSAAEDAIRLMEWMTGTTLMIRDHVFFRRIPAASRVCASRLRVLHSDLAAVPPPDFTDRAAVAEWAAWMAGRFGPVRNVARFNAVPEQRSYAA